MGTASGVQETRRHPNLRPTPPPIRQLCLRHFRSPDRKRAAVSASRHLERQLLVSQLPCASPVLWSWAPPPKPSQATSQQLRGAGMVDMIAKLARKQSRALRGQVRIRGLRAGAASDGWRSGFRAAGGLHPALLGADCRGSERNMSVGRDILLHGGISCPRVPREI